MSQRSFTDFCASIGCKLTNFRWSWCALSPDRKRAVFTTWSHGWTDGVYDLAHHGAVEEGYDDRRGYVEAVEIANLCADGKVAEVYGIRCFAKQPLTTPRVRESFDKNELLRLTVWRDDNGRVLARIVGTVKAWELRA
jgi:hypothetical protein